MMHTKVSYYYNNAPHKTLLAFGCFVLLADKLMLSDVLLLISIYY